MNYELAKRLKDAGFPNRVDINRVYIEDIPVPTLEDLIEACGNGFTCLMRAKDEWGSATRWAAGKPEARDGIRMYVVHGEPSGFGDTPEEAVANLWLAINENKQ